MPKGVPTTKSTDELLAQFELPASVERSALAIKRDEIEGTVLRAFGGFAQRLVFNTQHSADVEAVKGALVALDTSKKRVVKAVRAISDEGIQSILDDEAKQVEDAEPVSPSDPAENLEATQPA